MKNSNQLSNMVKVSILSALGFLLMFIEISLPIFPSFLKFDLSDIPALIGGVVIGPASGVLIELIKNLLNYIIKSSTGGIGDLANFIVGASLILPVTVIYKKVGKLKGYILGSVIGALVMLVVACVSNYYFFIPAFSAFYGMPIENFVAMTQKVNGFVSDYKTMIFFAIGPFNLLKAIIITVIGYFLSVRLEKILKR